MIDYAVVTSFDGRTLPVQDELTLLSRARQLDPEALAHIHDTYYTSIFRYVVFRVSDHATAEDLTSEVFTRLLTALRDKHAPQNTLRGWLYGVAARVVSDHHRQTYRTPQVELDESLASTNPDPADIVEGKLTRESVQRAMQDLTEEQRHVLSLRFGSDMPIQDVARALGKSEGAIKQLQARAVAALARQLSPKVVD
ncbi:ECF RNA polymerase sigma factor SigX [Thermoflexales bacterium]|jgi:RNA polymerase sigma-70 factor (ECF subfamily)|nr:ECF RNA polymerase sigma factor SigX [Thermoflexales bacterium]